MNRKIKFRVWDRKMNRMRHIAHPHLGTEYDIKEIFFDHEPWDADKLQLDIMQFTGLYDNAMKEVYEGDIVENQSGRKFVIEFIGSGFEFREIDMVNNYSTLSNRYCQHIGLFRIVGNIFENSELLK